MWKNLAAMVAGVAALMLPASAEAMWSKMSPGGGGSFKCVDIAADGKVLAGSDLSGVYLRSGTGEWTRLGRRDGIDATSVEAAKWQPGQSDIALIGTRNGLFKTVNGGVSWTSKGFTSRTVSAIAWNGDTVYIAHSSSATAANITVERSTNIGESWSSMNTSDLATGQRAVKLAIDPFSADTVWLLSGDDGFGDRPKELFKGAFSSGDWQKVSGSDLAIDFALHPTTPRLLLMTTAKYDSTDDRGFVSRSQNGGVSWDLTTAQNDTATGAIWWDGSTAYMINVQADACGTPKPLRSGKFQSTDNGVTWTKADSGATWETGWTSCANARGRSINTVAKTLSAKGEYWVTPQFVWRYASNKYENAFAAEVSSGAWLTKKIDNANPSAFASANDTLFAGYYDLGIWKSNNGGSSWLNINPSAMESWNGYGGNVTGITVKGNVLCATMARSSKDSSSVFRYSVWRSTDRGSSWILYRQNGITYPGFMYGLSRDPVTGDMWLTEDGRLYKSTNDGVDWTHTTGGDLPTHGLYVTRARSGVVLAGGTHGLYRWASPSGPWTEVHQGFNFSADSGTAGADLQRVRWHGIQQILFDPSIANRVWVVSYYKNGAVTTKRKGVWKSDDNGVTFAAVLDTVLCRGVAVDSSGFRLHITSGLAFSAGTSIAAELAASVGKQTCHGESDGSFNVNKCIDATNDALYRYPFGSVIHVPMGICGKIYVGVPGYGFMLEDLNCGGGGGGGGGCEEPPCEIINDGHGGGDGESAPGVVEGAADFSLELAPVEPSPSSGQSTLNWSISRAEAGSPFELSLFDIAGRRVSRIAGGIAMVGRHSQTFSFRADNGASLGSGVFFVRLRIGNQTLRRTVVLTR